MVFDQRGIDCMCEKEGVVWGGENGVLKDEFE